MFLVSISLPSDISENCHSIFYFLTSMISMTRNLKYVQGSNIVQMIEGNAIAFASMNGQDILQGHLSLQISLMGNVIMVVGCS